MLSQVRPFSTGFNGLILAIGNELMRKLVWHSGCIQPTGACACERNWSTYDYIHNKKRNRLGAAKAKQLVFVFSNRRLLKKVQAIDYEEQCLSWAEEEEEGSEEEEEAAEEEEEDF